MAKSRAEPRTRRSLSQPWRSRLQGAMARRKFGSTSFERGADRPSSPPRRGGRESKEGWEGQLSVNPRGFGFVTEPGREDVYVPPDALAPAMHGDRVRVAIVARSA